MSIKTLRKRIALVAVSALGAGLLSVAPASAALSAVDADTYDYTATGSVGICNAPVNTAAASSGTAHSAANNTTQATGEVLAGGTIAFTRSNDDQIATALDTVTISVSGGGTIASATGALNPVYGAGLTSLAQVNSSGSAASLASAFTVKAPSTAGAISVTISKNASGASATVMEIYTILVSASCQTGSASVANSIVKLGFYATVVTGLASITTNTTETSAATGDTADGDYEYAASAARIANGGQALIGVRIKDATASASDVTTQGIFTASATNGAVVGFDAAGLALQSSSATTAGPTTGSAQNKTVYVVQGTANKDKPLDTVVSVYFNGVLYGTRAIKFTGKATKIEVSAADSSVSKAAASGLGAVVYEITDAAGNLLTSDGTGVSGASSSGANNSPLVAASVTVVDPTQAIVSSGSVLAETSGAGGVTVTCGTGSGTAKITLKYVFSDLTSITSAPYDAACAYTAVNYKASLDKASYQPGEIATLTITATDKNGKPVYDVDASGDGVALGSTASPVSISLPQLTAVTAATNTDEFSGGKKTYKFTVGSTEGTFTGVVDLPRYNGTTYAQTAQTVTYKVASGTTGVTNAEVLAAIVKLIASINKQIRALQKSLRR